MADARALAAQIDASLAAVELDSNADARILAAIARSGAVTRRPWLPMVAAAAATAGFLLGIVIGVVSTPAPIITAVLEQAEDGTAPVPDEGTELPFVEMKADCRTHTVDGVLSLDGPCELALMQPSLRIRVIERARMVPTGAGVRVLDGWVAFDVDPVAEHAHPVRIEVPGGSIEVLGTRFSIWTDGSRGHVDLIEGHVRFHDAAGVRAVRPGERVTFDVEADASDATQPPPPPPPPGDPPGSGALVESLRQLARLRATGRHGEALELVESLLARAKEPERAEALSFEKGTLLQAMGRPTAACKHLARHLARFPDGRYARAVARHQHMLQCAR